MMQQSSQALKSRYQTVEQYNRETIIHLTGLWGVATQRLQVALKTPSKVLMAMSEIHHDGIWFNNVNVIYLIYLPARFSSLRPEFKSSNISQRPVKLFDRHLRDYVPDTIDEWPSLFWMTSAALPSLSNSLDNSSWCQYLKNRRDDLP